MGRRFGSCHDLDADVDVARSGSRGKGELGGADAHDRPVALVKRANEEGALAGALNGSEPGACQFGWPRARDVAQRRAHDVIDDRSANLGQEAAALACHRWCVYRLER